MNEYLRLNNYKNGKRVYVNPMHLAIVSDNEKSTTLHTNGGGCIEVMETAEEVFNAIGHLLSGTPSEHVLKIVDII